MNRYMLGGNKLAMSTLQQAAATWRAVTLLAINVSWHCCRVKRNYKLPFYLERISAVNIYIYIYIYILSSFKRATFSTKFSWLPECHM
jgi:hypothetical protein